MNNRNYPKEKLQNADENQLSFLVSVNLLNSSESILQYPFVLFKNTKKGWGRNRDLEEHELFASFQCIVTAIELLLKSRISLIDYKLLFSNHKKISRESLINGDFKSINFESCIQLIENNTKLAISDRIKDGIDNIRIIRNRVTHYYDYVDKDQFLNYIAIGLNIYIDFYREHIMEFIFDSYDRTEGFEEELSDFNEFILLRVEYVKEKMKNNNYIQAVNPECNRCWTGNLYELEDGTCACLYCGSVTKKEI